MVELLNSGKPGLKKILFPIKHTHKKSITPLNQKGCPIHRVILNFQRQEVSGLNWEEVSTTVFVDLEYKKPYPCLGFEGEGDAAVKCRASKDGRTFFRSISVRCCFYFCFCPIHSQNQLCHLGKKCFPALPWPILYKYSAQMTRHNRINVHIQLLFVTGVDYEFQLSVCPSVCPEFLYKNLEFTNSKY